MSSMPLSSKKSQINVLQRLRDRCLLHSDHRRVRKNKSRPLALKVMAVQNRGTQLETGVCHHIRETPRGRLSRPSSCLGPSLCPTPHESPPVQLIEPLTYCAMLQSGVLSNSFIWSAVFGSVLYGTGSPSQTRSKLLDKMELQKPSQPRCHPWFAPQT